MNNRSLVLVLLLCLACMALGVGFGKYAFGCQRDAHGADHVFFRAPECFSVPVERGYSVLECQRRVMP